MTYFDEFFDSCWAWTILLPSRSIKFDKLSKGAEKHLVKFGENCPRRNLVVQGNSHSNWPQVVLAGFLNNQQVCFFPKTPRNSRKLWRIGNRQVSLPYCERDHPHVPPNESHELVYASERLLRWHCDPPNPHLWRIRRSRFHSLMHHPHSPPEPEKHLSPLQNMKA